MKIEIALLAAKIWVLSKLSKLHCKTQKKEQLSKFQDLQIEIAGSFSTFLPLTWAADGEIWKRAEMKNHCLSHFRKLKNENWRKIYLSRLFWYLRPSLTGSEMFSDRKLPIYGIRCFGNLFHIDWIFQVDTIISISVEFTPYLKHYFIFREGCRVELSWVCSLLLTNWTLGRDADGDIVPSCWKTV